MKRINRVLISIFIFFLLMPSLALAQTDGAGIEIKVDSDPSKQISNEIKQSQTSSGKAQNYMLITNESVIGGKKQSTGTPVIKNSNYKLEQKVRPEAFRMDINMPLDVERLEDKQIKSNSKSIMFKSSVKVGETKSFWVFDFVYFRNVKKEAKLLYSGNKAMVWVGDNEITKGDATKLGKEFDENIYPAITKNFANESDVDNDGKINILCYDIKDGFEKNGGYIAGYFNPGDLFNISGSNRSEIFYIDTKPSMGLGSKKDVTKAYTTLAHEFQHMVNFNQNVLVEGGKEMDPWLDEGLAMAAEQIYTGKVLKDRIDYYNSSVSIRNGHSLLYWDETGDVLANYSLSYLFVQYLRAQSGQKDAIYKEIIESPRNNYKAVEKAGQKYIDKNLTFGKLMTNFRAALLLKEKTGVYGFNGEPGFNTIKPRLYNGSSALLRGGGAIVKKSTGTETIPTTKGKNITYTFFGPGEPRDHTAPDKPSVQKVSDQDKVVKGKAEAGARVYVKAGTAVIGKAVSDSKKSFSVPIKKQKAGTKLKVYAKDKAGNRSAIVTLTVLDKTPPARPQVSEVSNRDLKVSGKAEAGSKVVVRSKGGVLGSGTADKAKKYAIELKTRQKAGSTLYVTAKDKAGNVSKAREVIVVDKIPPKEPKVNKVTNRTTVVKGQAEANARVYVKVGKSVLGSAKAEPNGRFSVEIKRQKTGTVLLVYAKDKAGNKGKAASVTVKKPK